MSTSSMYCKLGNDEALNRTGLIREIKRYSSIPGTVMAWSNAGGIFGRSHQRYYSPGALLVKYPNIEADELIAQFRHEISRKLPLAMWYHEEAIRPLANALACTNYSALSVEFIEHEGYLVNLRYGQRYTVHIQIMFGVDALIENPGYYNVYDDDELVIFGESSLDKIVAEVLEYVSR